MASSGEPPKVLVLKRKKTRLEESQCSGRLGLDSFSDDLLKFRANASVDLEDYEASTEEETLQSDSATFLNGTREETFFAKKHTAEDFERSCQVALSTVVHARDASKPDLETYLQQVFSLSPEKYRGLVAKITKEEVYIQTMHVQQK
jgi:hypothetical protein